MQPSRLYALTQNKKPPYPEYYPQLMALYEQRKRTRYYPWTREEFLQAFCLYYKLWDTFPIANCLRTDYYMPSYASVMNFFGTLDNYYAQGIAYGNGQERQAYTIGQPERVEGVS